jgi:hypothetical protein
MSVETGLSQPEIVDKLVKGCMIQAMDEPIQLFEGHTPLPWRVVEDEDSLRIVSGGGDSWRRMDGDHVGPGRIVAYVHSGPLIRDAARANAELIVLAVNECKAGVRMS